MIQGVSLNNSQFDNRKQLQDLFYLKSPSPVDFVNTVIFACVEAQASDILLEPRKDALRVRMRVDGVLYELGKLDLGSYSHISARIKVLSKLDTTEKRRIQEGQLTLDYQGRTINLRIEIAQTVHGELIVIRIHERKTIVMELTQLGLSDESLETYKKILKLRSGLILVCGPTGCGKTTTLYSTINKINEKQDLNVMTIEDPVEFQLEGANQMQTQTEIGFTFADGLKTILRLSPDVVLVGEIRDKETAEIAVESGLTGQLVLSTIHAEDSVGALFRLLDLGIQTYLLNSSLVGIVSQRLVRKVCQDCGYNYDPSDDERDIFMKTLGRVPDKLVKGAGCDKCKKLAFHGRTGIYEILLMNAFVRDLIRKEVNEDELRKALIASGFPTLLKEGLIKCEQGLTTVDEVLKSSFIFS